MPQPPTWPANIHTDSTKCLNVTFILNIELRGHLIYIDGKYVLTML